jgi:hypothetical protein
LATDIVKKGNLERASHINRGKPLLYSEAVWRSKSQPYRRRRQMWSYAFSIGFVGVPLFLLIFVLVFLPEFGGILGYVLLFGILTISFGIIAVFTHRADRKELASTPPEGLYERGVQLLHFIFVPYEEISGVKKSSVKGNTLIELHLHDHEHESIKERQPWVWTIPLDFLGEDGLKELVMRVYGASSPEESRIDAE